MSIALSLGILGVLAVLEAVVSMMWKSNDRTLKAQISRAARIVGGLYLVVVGTLGWVPAVAVTINLGSWNGLLQTAINASISGTAMYLAVRYVGKVVERVESSKKTNGNGASSATK